MLPFQRTFIFENELALFGLPCSGDQPDIMNLVELASTLIDEHCGRMDGDGGGSLVFTTYAQRILLQTSNRNLIALPMKPIVAVPASVVLELTASGNATGGNYYYTGVQANTITGFNGQLSGIIAASGRYGYMRQSQSIGCPDLFAAINPLNLITMFGGPAPWLAIDVTNIDYDTRTGEVWIPAGLQLQRYTEVLFTYNSGFDPRTMPRPIKLATAAVVKNAMSKGGGTTGLTSLTVARSGVNVTMGPHLIDENVDLMLTSYKTVRAY